MRQVTSWHRMARLSHVTSIDCVPVERVPVGTKTNGWTRNASNHSLLKRGGACSVRQNLESRAVGRPFHHHHSTSQTARKQAAFLSNIPFVLSVLCDIDPRLTLGLHDVSTSRL